MLREVQLNIGVKKLDMHEGITIKALLNSGTTGIFIDRKMAARHGFKLQKLEKPIAVRNVDGTNNSREAITHQVKVNIYYKNHIERMRMDICDFGKTEIIFGMPQLATHNPEINWEIGEVKNDEMPTLVWQGKIKRERKEKKRKESSNSKRRESHQMGNRQ